MMEELYTMSKFLWLVLNELQHCGIIQFKAVEDPCKMASLTAKPRPDKKNYQQNFVDFEPHLPKFVNIKLISSNYRKS
jgi:hypothetical protein